MDEKKEVKLRCEACGEFYMGDEPNRCCSGHMCGCLGLPIDPILCESCIEQIIIQKTLL